MTELNEEEERLLETVLTEFQDVSKEVKVLNKNVYTKNYLDKTRNFLILGFIITFLIVSAFLGILLNRQESNDETRAKEAAAGRRQIADCTVKPGVVLDDGYINPGKCYKESTNRTSEAIKTLTVDIQEGVRQLLLIQAEAVAANETLEPEVRSFARQQVIALRDFVPKTQTTNGP